MWTEFVPSPRDEIIDRVQRGEMTPQEAESEAARLGLETFKSEPDPSQFDPMREVMLTLPMALAWIIWRSADAVREMWDAYRFEFRFWFFQRWQVPGGPVYDGHFLTKKDAAGLWDIELQVQLAPPALAEINGWNDAIRLLKMEAQLGRIVVRGIPTDGGPPKVIPAVEWDDLWVQEIEKRAVVRFNSYRFPRVGYNNVLVEREALMRVFPAVSLLVCAPSAETCNPAAAQVEPQPAINFSRKTMAAAIRAAAQAVYPEGLPASVTAKERDRALGDYIVKAGGKRPSERTFRRALK